METSRLASLHEPNLCGTQLVVVVVINKSSGNISIKSRTTEISLNFGSSTFVFIKVTDISNMDKNEAKQTKPSTGLERALETKAEGIASNDVAGEMCGVARACWWEMVAAYDDKVDFIRELEAVPGIAAAVKTAEFINDALWKDDRRIQRLWKLQIDADLMAYEKEKFTEKL
ncbi:hypothetical protein Tco_0610932 [Tanacetum coccineum]